MNIAITLLVILAVVAGAVLYLRQHHINLYQKLHDRISQNNGSLDQALSQAFDSLHHRLDDIHTATQTPVVISQVPQQSASPAAPAAPAAPGTTTPSDTTAGPTAVGAPLQAAAQPDSVVFDPSQYTDPAVRKQAAQDLLAKLVAQYGNYNTKVVGPHGWTIDPQGNEIVPDNGLTAEDVTAPENLQYVPGGGQLQVGQITAGVPIYLKGTCHKNIKGIPNLPYRVGLMVTSRKASNYIFSVNGTVASQGMAGMAIQFVNAQGDTLNLDMQQDADCTMLAFIQFL